MKSISPRLKVSFILVLTLSSSAPAFYLDAPVIVPREEILAELRTAPGPNTERVERIRELYVQAGAPEASIELQPVKGRRPDDPLLHNVVVTKKGKQDKRIVVGGHLDKVTPGDGVIDDWSGSCMATNLYQALKDVETEHTFVFVGFAYEEQGLVGSREYVKSLGDHAKDRVAAMVNLECLGVGGPFLWTNGSNDALESLAHQVAKAKELPLEDHVIRGVGADSIPFDQVGIPTITFDGLPLERMRLIHSDDDRYDKISEDVYVTTFELLTHYLLELDRGVPEATPRPVATPALQPAPAPVEPEQ